MVYRPGLDPETLAVHGPSGGTMSIHWFGYVGTALVIVAYLPQITHLVRDTCSAGLSFRAYVIWVVAAVLLLTYAVLTRDAVFMALQSYQVLATGLICFYCKRFEHNLCDIHGGPPRGGLRPARPVLDHEGR
jgi:uncharacterized protein with PQ loop repeat